MIVWRTVPVDQGIHPYASPRWAVPTTSTHVDPNTLVGAMVAEAAGESVGTSRPYREGVTRS